MYGRRESLRGMAGQYMTNSDSKLVELHKDDQSMSDKKAIHERNKAGTSKAEAHHKKVLFVEAMIQNGGNATQAAVYAGYKAGYAAEKAGLRLSKDVWVRGELAVRRVEVQKAAHLETERLLEETAKIVFSDIRKVFNKDGTLKMPHEWSPDIASAIATFEVIESKSGMRTIRIKLWDKNAAIEKVMKHLGLFEIPNTQKSDPLGDLLRAIDGSTGSII